MKPVKVMHIIGSMDLGGAEKLTRLTLEGLSREEFDLSVCCLKAGGFYAQQLEKKGFPIRVLLHIDKHGRSGVLGTMRVAWRLFCLLRQERPDIVHSHLFLASALARLTGWLAGCRCHVVTLHRIEYPGVQPRCERLLAPLARRYVTDSQAAARLIASGLGVPRDKIDVIYNGIDTAEFADPPTRAAARARLALDESEFVIGVVAHLYPEKGHAVLLEALAGVQRELGNFRLLVVGDGHLRPMLEAQAASKFEKGRIQFLGQRGDLAALLAAMDLLVLPSSWEGFGIILAEAMYMRVPVIATSDGGGCAEVVEEGQGGALVPYGDAPALGRAVMKFRTDEAFRADQGRCGRARVEKQFVSAIMAARYAAMYRRVGQTRI